MQKIAWLGMLCCLVILGCQDQPTNDRLTNNTTDENLMTTPVKDIHSFSDPEKAIMQHLVWKAQVNFDSSRIYARASIKILRDPTAKNIVLDTKDLTIEKVTIDTDQGEIDTKYAQGDADPILGSPLRIALQDDTEWVHVYYHTSSSAEALQWLSPQQTSGKTSPFLFTQSQAILARSWIPLQDSPGIRFTYEAEVEVPAHLLALMSASNPQEKNAQGVYKFKMNQPIPAYLMALAVGDLRFESLGPRSGVYSEPKILEKAKNEFTELEPMIEAAEALYGPYRWERYDLLVLPPSFPFGGMENPRLTFATPTILAGDRSLTSLVAHELAHSWSGNLVTNATWEDFWLNEGFTVYFEQRIMEALYGLDYSEMLASLALQDLKAEIKELREQGNKADTHLQLNLQDRNPDDGMTAIAYDKGYLFLRWMEERVGRELWDEFLKTYFENNAFRSITTAQFLAYLQKNLIEKHHINIYSEDINAWIYGPGLPEDRPKPVSDRFKIVEEKLAQWNQGNPINTNKWSTHEWLHFIKNLPVAVDSTKLSQLDSRFNFTNSGNAEIQAAWYLQCIQRQYTPAYQALEKFLITVGRRKFLVPLYKALAESETGLILAQNIYQKARPNYHFVARSSIDVILEVEKDH